MVGSASFRGIVAGLLIACGTTAVGADGLVTWDGKHSIDKIDVTVVYFVPRDRTPLPDWRERVDYFCRRIRQFHEREFRGQSVLTTKPHEKPFRSARSTEQLRSGDGDFTFFQTLREVDADLAIDAGERKAYPILLVLSDINWRPLDDFYRLQLKDGKLQFEGNLTEGRHFPGAASGGARATYLADRGVGWGLVSGDGWRVPYCGSDCVVYHEGLGHTIGLPHPEPGNGSVMSLGQYRGWLSESWLDDDQKKRLRWKPPEKPIDRGTDLFSKFRAVPDPAVPKPGEKVALKFDWPAEAKVRSLRVRMQTDLWGPWIDVAVPSIAVAPQSVALGPLDRPTPVSYRVDAALDNGEAAEVWGYFQVRSDTDANPLPAQPVAELEPAAAALPDREEIDLLAMIDVEKDRVAGEWSKQEGRIVSPKAFGARIEIPYVPPEEYRLTVIAEPLDEPDALNLGLRAGGQRFLALVNYGKDDAPASALENIDGKNVGNATTLKRRLLKKGQPAQIVGTVRKDSVTVTVDGIEIIRWTGDRARLSLSDYWKTPNNVLFLGAYDCRYRISRVTLRPIAGEGRRLREE